MQVLEKAKIDNSVSNSIKEYWTYRSESYSEQNKRELESQKADKWTQTILENVDKQGTLKILDIGCGPGEFSILMAKAGHEAVGVDMTEAMLEQARKNAELHNVEPSFMKMDVQNLEFDDCTFDLIISRNVTWNLQDPEGFFKECRRVLKDDGKIVYFDANWYLFLFDEEARKAKEKSDKNYERIYGEKSSHSISKICLTDIAYGLPMSKANRPNWDIENLPKFELEVERVDRNINARVLNEREQIDYEATPLFTIVAKKL